MPYPLVSVIIPVYNASAFLAASLQELLKQTYPAIEIILVDDSSTDNSLAVARTFEGGNIKVFTQPNAGAAAARNAGLRHATGQYIQFLDADDFLSPGKIEKQVTALEKYPGKVAVCNYINFILDTDIIIAKPPDQSHFIYSDRDPAGFLINLWGGKTGMSNFVQTNCWLTPRSVVDKAGEWRQYRCPDDDGEFFSRVILASEGVEYVPGIYNYYRRSLPQTSLSQNAASKYVHNVLLTINLKLSYLLAVKNKDEVKSAFAKQYLDFAVYNYPQHKILSAISFRRYKLLNTKSQIPLLGGKIIETIKSIFGWRVARLITYYLR